MLGTQQSITIDSFRLKGIYRSQCYEYWQSLGVSNTHQLNMTQIESTPHSIRLMEALLDDIIGNRRTQWFRNEVIDDYNAGRRACV